MSLKPTIFSADSRQIKEGGLFLAVKGVSKDGRNFIKDAIQNGAKTILTSSDTDTTNIPKSINVVKHDNPRKKYSEMIVNFYQPHPKNIAMVTGTNGKTSVANFAQQLWYLNNKQSISIGTLGVSGCGYIPCP